MSIFRIEEATISQLQWKMAEEDLTSRQLVQAYLQRIEAIDRQGVKLNSILELNPEAEEIAVRLDIERKHKGPRGPLHGIPILLKDSIDTNDRMHTSAGSIALANHIAHEDAYVVRRLREAGAVILGKTNMTEWANYMSWDMPAGYSSRGGFVLNPYGPGTIFVGGSSTGSAVAVAAGLAAGSIGTETSGSIISPAVQNSIVGIKTTVGLIQRNGIIPLAHSQDSPGPMARTVADAAIILSALVGSDDTGGQDEGMDDHQFWRPGGRRKTIDYTSFLDENGLIGARIGIPRKYYGRLHPSKQALMAETINTLKKHGAVIVDPVEIPSAGYKWTTEVLRHEFKHDINAYLSLLDSNVPVHSLAELIEFNAAHEQEALRFGQSILIWAEETSGTLTEPVYIEALKKNIEMSTVRGIDYAIKRNNLDALLFPGAKGSDINARAGNPSITVPAGYSQGAPYGVTFSGLAFSEPLLIRLAYAYEQATKHRIPPNLF